MKRLNFLKILITILFVICCIFLFFFVPFILIVAVMPQQVPFTINNIPATEVGLPEIAMLIIVAVTAAIATYAIYLFKNTLVLFEKKKVFHNDVISNFNKMGKAILGAFIIYIVSSLLYSLIVNSEIGFEVSLATFLIPASGLFFLVLSDVFKMGKAIKEETELTI